MDILCQLVSEAPLEIRQYNSPAGKRVAFAKSAQGHRTNPLSREGAARGAEGVAGGGANQLNNIQ